MNLPIRPRTDPDLTRTRRGGGPRAALGRALSHPQGHPDAADRPAHLARPLGHAENMRLFAAVRPPDDALDHLEGALASVRGGPAARPRPGQAGLRWTPPADRHVTLAFFGQVPEGYLDELAVALDDVARATVPFEASLAGAGLFDRRTLWIGCTGDGWTALMTAAGAIGSEVAGRPADGRNRPHLTVARARPGSGGRDARRASGRDRGRGLRAGLGAGHGAGVGRGDRPTAPAERSVDPATLAHALALYRGPVWTVREVELVASRLGAGPGGSPVHDVVHRSGLGPVAG